jgi:hypothetical protein
LRLAHRVGKIRCDRGRVKSAMRPTKARIFPEIMAANGKILSMRLGRD